MSSSRRCAVVLALALVSTAVFPAVASGAPRGSTSTSATTTKNTTTTTGLDPSHVPPPAPFSLPIQLGLQLLKQRTDALHDLQSFGSELPRDRARQAAVQRSWNALQLRLDKLDKQIAKTQHELDLARADLQQAAVAAYMNADTGQLEAAISAIASARDALEANRTMRLIGSYGDQEHDAAVQYTELKRALGHEKAVLTAERHVADAKLASAKKAVSTDETQIAHAHVRLTASVVGILQFEKAATSATSPILGPSALTAQQLADYVRASGRQPRITVPLGELARDYITEGEKAGVRGDVAFAQSILETAWFTFPGGGQVAVRDNNFAGIGACDSCAHGFSFESADVGVRAQMQALRIYVDPNLTATTLVDPLVMPKMLDLGFRGKVQTWWDLWGTWATGAFYGQRVYDIYERMVEFAHTDPARADPAHA